MHFHSIHYILLAHAAALVAAQSVLTSGTDMSANSPMADLVKPAADHVHVQRHHDGNDQHEHDHNHDHDQHDHTQMQQGISSSKTSAASSLHVNGPLAIASAVGGFGLLLTMLL